MDRPNLFVDDTDFNICLSWLCGSTDGGTYSITYHFAKKLKRPENMGAKEWVEKTDGFFDWQEWNDAIGFKHDYRVDDPVAIETARKMAKNLNELVDTLNADPDYLHWDRNGVWLLECKLNGKDYFTFKYRGKKSIACKFSADLVISELGDGDGENGGRGSLKNCIGDIADSFMTSGAYYYADCIFHFREVTEEA